MEDNKINQFLSFLECPICEGNLNQNCFKKLKCEQCNWEYKIHKGNILKLFTPENIYPTKDKINWKNLYE